MSKARRNPQDSDPEVGRTQRGEPTLRQQQVLSAYLEDPNAAAVGRELHVSERNVRRLVERFADRLGEMSRERDQERRLRADAREAKVQIWADGSLEDSLQRLDALAESSNDGTALRAIKLKIELALRAPRATTLPSNLDRDLERAERGLSARLYAIEANATEGQEGGESDEVDT